MPCFLDTGPFGKLLTAIDHKNLPPAVLSETLLSPVTALELAQHTPKLRILLQYRAYLRPLSRAHSRVVLDFDWGQDFAAALASKGPDHFRSLLNVMHTQCVVYQPFLDFHLSRYGSNPPKTIANSQRHTSDIRDSMQLIISPEVPFITSDRDLVKKLSPLMPCQSHPQGLKRGDFGNSQPDHYHRGKCNPRLQRRQRFGHQRPVGRSPRHRRRARWQPVRRGLWLTIASVF